MSDEGDCRLVLVRHGKAVPKGTVPDLERPLADRGRGDASWAGDRLARSGVRVDLTLCSPSLRTRETWQLMAAHLAAAPPAVYDDRLYRADADALAAVLAGTRKGIGTVLLVGHNPGIHELARRLCVDGPEEGLERIGERFPTSAIAVVSFTGGWGCLPGARGRLLDHWTPRD